MSLKTRYVALGDSTGVGVGATREGGYVERLFQRLRREHDGVGLLNLCVSGATSQTVRSGQLARAVAARPTLVTVGVGTNDLWRLVPEATFEANLAAICADLAATGAHGVLCNVPDLSLAPVARLAPPGLLRGRFETFNRIVERVAHEAGFAVVDLFTRSQEAIPARPDFFCADGFHPSDAGYALWADVMWPTFLAAAERARIPSAP